MKKFTLLLIIAFLTGSIRLLPAQDHTESNATAQTYGERPSLGIAIGGGALVGVPLRLHFSKNLVGELGFFYRPTVLVETTINDEIEEIKISSGFLVAGGFNYFLKGKPVEWKRKYRKQGLFLKGGHNFSSFSDSFVATGWVWETFRMDHANRSFIVELGPALFFNHWLDDPSKAQYSDNANEVYFSIYCKIHWNWYL